MRFKILFLGIQRVLVKSIVAKHAADRAEISM